MLTPVRRWLAGAALLAGLASISAGAAAQNGTVVWIQPAAGTHQVGETFAVDVRIENVFALYGVDVHVAFDPTRLQVVESTVTPETGLLSPPWQVYFNQVNNQAGTVWYVATLLNPHLPVSGSGALFSFHFRARAEGPAAADITEHTLSDINGEAIPATTAGAVYQVGPQVRHQVFLASVLRRDSRTGSSVAQPAAPPGAPHWRNTGGGK